jgi:hypothetical protein
MKRTAYLVVSLALLVCPVACGVAGTDGEDLEHSGNPDGGTDPTHPDARTPLRLPDAGKDPIDPPDPRPDGGRLPPQGGAVGDPCTAGGDCEGGTCLKLPGGYCTKTGCAETGCPDGSVCFSLEGGGSACFKSCTSPSECRQPEGYTCDADKTCYPGGTPVDPACSPQNPHGTCPEGQLCQNGMCATLECTDTRFETNDTAGAAKPAPDGATTGLEVCGTDQDWFSLSVPAHTIATLGVTFQRSVGDLDLSAHTQGSQCLGGRVSSSCSWTYRDYETGEEFLSTLNNTHGQTLTSLWRLIGYRGAQNRYDLVTKLTPWSDGRDCRPTYTEDDCLGHPSTSPQLIQFPYPDANDGYVGDGYRFDSVANYRWLRRETIMLVRYAIAETQKKFPGTKPLGLIDMCQRNGITPGYDVNDPRHPESTHDQGGNIDIAYYTTLASEGSLAYNEARIICDANEGNQDGSYCNASAAQTHVVDLPRQVYFMAKLFESPRARVIGADRVIAPLLKTEAARQHNLGWITAAQRDAFTSGVASGNGWPFHHHHIHLSLEWWPSFRSTGSAPPQDGCGFDLEKHR